MELEVQTARRVKDFSALAAEWTNLAESQVFRTPFQSVDWNRLWWKHFRRDTPRCRDELRLITVRRCFGPLVAVLPMMLTYRPAKLPLRTRELQFLGADGNVTEIRGMLCLPGWEEAVLEAVGRHFLARQEWDWIQWRGLTAPPPALLGAFRPSSPLLDFTLKLPKTWDELRAGLSRNMKEALRKCANALPRDGHDHKVDVISAPDEIRPALRQLIRLHALRAAADGGVLHPNVFAAQAARGFITEIVHELARRGEVRIFSLSVSGQPVAMRLGFVCASDLYLYYSGYDPAWGRYSVMTTVVAEAIKWAIQQGFDRVNLSTGSDPSKLRWRPEQLELLEGTQSSAKLRSQFALAAMELARASSA